MSERMKSLVTTSSRDTTQAGPAKSKPRFPLRLALLVLLGVLAVSISIRVRNSAWARERQLKTLSVEELALAVHDNPTDQLTWGYYGVALLNAGHSKEAVGALQYAVSLNPKVADAHLSLGNAYLRMGNMPAALQSVQEAVKLEPDNPGNLLSLAKATYAMGSPRKAIEPLKKVVALQPDNAYAWYSLGKMYGESSESDLAYEALKKATALDPKQALSWRDLGQISRHYSRFQEAEEQFQKAIALNPKDPTAHFWLGQMYLQMGDTPALRTQAQQQLENAVSLDPQMGDAQLELGRLKERQSDWVGAVEHLRIATNLNASDDQALYHFGLCLIKIGKVDAGKAAIATAQELAKAKHDIEDTQNRIRLDPQNRPLHLQMARLFRKYENDEDAVSEYKVYERMGVEDRAVRAEFEKYKAELKRKAEAELRQKAANKPPAPAAAPPSASGSPLPHRACLHRMQCLPHPSRRQPGMGQACLHPRLPLTWRLRPRSRRIHERITQDNPPRLHWHPSYPYGRAAGGNWPDMRLLVQAEDTLGNPAFPSVSHFPARLV